MKTQAIYSKSSPNSFYDTILLGSSSYDSNSHEHPFAIPLVIYSVKVIYFFIGTFMAAAVVKVVLRRYQYWGF